MKQFDHLNEAQRKAVMHGEGPMLVLAGPGSGKTFTITNRIFYLIEHNKVDPSNILVITFTKEAAMNMKNRFLSSHSNSLPVHFGTFHSIFYQILKSSGYRQTDAILTDSEKKRYIIPILKDYILQTDKNHYLNDTIEADAVKILAAISCYKNTGNIVRSVQMTDERYRNDFMMLFEAYEQKRKRNNRMDFDDMLYQCFMILSENEDLMKTWKERFSYILIDEFQDINSRQYEIIKLLAGKSGNLFAVGDDDQSIYGFRGATPGIMQKFTEDYPDCKKIFLTINYRSFPEIVRAAGIVIEANRVRFKKQLKSYNRNANGTICLERFTHKLEQYHFLAELMKTKTADELRSIAILFRTNSQMQGFSSMLRRLEIPYTMKEKGKCIYDHFVAVTIRNYIEFACGDKRRTLFLTFMNKPYRRIIREALQDDLISFEKIRKYYINYFPQKELASYLFPLAQLEEDLNRLPSMSPYLGIQYIRRKMQFESYLRKKAGTDYQKLNEWLEILEILCEEATGFKDYSSWFTFQDTFKTEMNKKDVKKEEDGIKLMTVHGSKGLEFENVWIPDLNEGIFPYGHMQTEETIEEERRLLYVAMTRAKKSLGLTYVTGTKDRPRLMSRFLNMLIELY